MLPPQAKKVFSGKLFEVWQWRQVMYDGSTRIFERLKRPNTVEVIATTGNMVIIQLEQQPHKQEAYLTTPGGRCDGDEKPLDAIKRELAEETGYTSLDWKLWFEESPVGKIEWTIYTYIARNCTLTEHPHLDGGEKITTQLVSFDEFVKIATEDTSFYSPGITKQLLRMRLNPKKLEAFRQILFS